MQKTLGGDRLGSGKKQKVFLNHFERSTHDLGFIFRSTMSAGTLVPFMSILALPGDTFDIDLECDVKTHPTTGPLFGSFKVQLDIFQAPIRLYNGKLHNNKLGIGMKMQNVKLPYMELQTNRNYSWQGDINTAQINQSCILAYLGIRGVGQVPKDHLDNVTRTFNAVPLLAYWEIYKQYYANKMEDRGAVIHNGTTDTIQGVDSITMITPGEVDTILGETGVTPPNGMYFNQETVFKVDKNTDPVNWENVLIYGTYPGVGTQWMALSEFNLTTENATEAQFMWSMPTGINGYADQWRYRQDTDPYNGKIRVATFPLEDIDEMRETILSETLNPNAFNINQPKLYPYTYLFEKTGISWSMQSSQEGLGLKTYQSDLFNNWLNTEWLDGTTGINSITAIDTSSGSFNIDTLILAKKVYNMLNRIAVSGGTYDDWLDAVYTEERFTRAESPIYHGGLIRELVFQEVVSNSQTPEQPLGSLAGKGVLGQKKKGGHVTIKVDEPSYIIGIVSLTPRIDYSQGNQWDVHLKTIDDLHKPSLDQIGFQELITEQMAFWDTVYNPLTDTWELKSAGKQPAWINYMTNINKTYGNFANESEMWMTLNRRYESQQNGTMATIKEIKDLTTYIDPVKYNQIFADTSLDSMNFWTQIACDITARRKLSAKVMPNL